MFVGGEAEVKIGYTRAQARLAALAGNGWLHDASRAAYREGIRGLAESGRPGTSRGMTRLAEVHIREQGAHGALAGVALRWDAAGPGGQPFPALDADVLLGRSGAEATALTITGVYRRPAGISAAVCDQATVRDIATATIEVFLGHLVWALTAPHAAGPGRVSGEGKPPPTAKPS